MGTQFPKGKGTNPANSVARYLHRASLLKSKSVPYGEAGSVAIPGGKTTPGIYPRCEAWGAGR